jgi:glucan phosphoethanolaminetransferase (alkaline phosphatase superfamily)
MIAKDPKTIQRNSQLLALICLSFVYGYINWIAIGLYHFGLWESGSIFSLVWLPLCVYFAAIFNLIVDVFTVNSRIRFNLYASFVFVLSFAAFSYANEFWMLGQQSMCTSRNDFATNLFNNFESFLIRIALMTVGVLIITVLNSMIFRCLTKLFMPKTLI